MSRLLYVCVLCVWMTAGAVFHPLTSTPPFSPPLLPHRDRQEASYDGVLGGQAAVNDADVSESRAFLTRVLGADRVAAAARGGAATPPHRRRLRRGRGARV